MIPKLVSVSQKSAHERDVYAQRATFKYNIFYAISLYWTTS